MDMPAKKSAKVSAEKLELVTLLTSYYNRFNEEKRNRLGLPIVNQTQWAEEFIGIERSALNKYMSRANPGLPDAVNGLRIANYLVREFGTEALRFYAVLGWPTPIVSPSTKR